MEILSDIVRLESKNLVIHRNFENLPAPMTTKKILRKMRPTKNKRGYFDVWLVDFIKEASVITPERIAEMKSSQQIYSSMTETDLTNRLFALQLACIVAMVPKYADVGIR